MSIRRLIYVSCLVLTLAGVREARAVEGPAEGVQTPEERIQAAPIPPQGKECLDEAAAEESTRDFVRRKRIEAYREAAIRTIQNAEEVADRYWDEQEAAFVSEVRRGADAAVAVAPEEDVHICPPAISGRETDCSNRMAWTILSDMAVAIDCEDGQCPNTREAAPGAEEQPGCCSPEAQRWPAGQHRNAPLLSRMPRRICVSLASRNTALCREVGLLESAGISAQAPAAVRELLPDMCGFIEHAYEVGSWDDRNQCEVLEGWQKKMCQRWFVEGALRNGPRGVELCQGLGAMEYFACSLFVSTVGEELAYCGKDLNAVACMFSLMWWSIGGREGVQGCERLRSKRGATSPDHDVLYRQCKAVMRGEPLSCPLDTANPTVESPTLEVSVDAMLRGGSRGVQPVVTVVASSPSACALSLGIAAQASDEGAQGQIVGVQTTSRRVERVVGAPLSPEVRPFEQRLSIESVCVPTVDWGHDE